MHLSTKSKPLESACIKQTREEVDPAVLPRSATCFWSLHSWRQCWGHQQDPCSCDMSGTHQEEESKESGPWSCLGGLSATQPAVSTSEHVQILHKLGLLWFCLNKEGGIFWTGVHYYTSPNENKAVLSLFQSKLQACFTHSPCHFYSKGIPVTSGNFLVSSQNEILMLPVYTWKRQVLTYDAM